MTRSSNLRRRAAICFALTMAALMTVAQPASAGVLPITCTAAGTVGFVDGSPTDTWTVAGKGSCQGDMQGTYFLDFAGSGTSKGLGVCDVSPLVQDLNILVTSTLTKADTGAIKTFVHRWKAPVTTYPLATPFYIEHVPAEVPIGGGVFLNHIFLACYGSPVAQFDFTFLT